MSGFTGIYHTIHEPGPVIIKLFSSTVRKYRKSYCSHPCVGVSISVDVGVAHMLKFLVKVFMNLYVLKC